jgi:integration host factor beta subunit
MTKTELISKVSEGIDGLTKKDAAVVVDAVFEEITKALVGGDSVKIAGFGAFSVTERAARTARNPRTGEVVEVKASKAPKFKAAKALKDQVNA